MLAFAPVPVETDFVSGADGWRVFTRHMEQLLEFMEKTVWPIDPEADVMPQCLMPFVYATESGEEDESVLKSLLLMLSLGLQGECFKWKYKFDFDVVFSNEKKGYLVLLNSVRREWNRGLSEPVASETAGAGAGAGAGADAQSAASASADFSASKPAEN